VSISSDFLFGLGLGITAAGIRRDVTVRTSLSFLGVRRLLIVSEGIYGRSEGSSTADCLSVDADCSILTTNAATRLSRLSTLTRSNALSFSDSVARTLQSVAARIHCCLRRQEPTKFTTSVVSIKDCRTECSVRLSG